MKSFFYVISIIGCILMSGCGTNVATEIKTTGVDATIPIYGIPVGVRLGNAEVTTVATRGNTTYVTQNVTGGGLWSASAGTGRISILSSGPQFNEGYINETLQSPHVSEAVKLAIAEKYLAQTRAPEISPTAVKTLAAASGQGVNPPVVEPASTGTDKLIDKAAEVIPQVTPAVTDTVKSVGNNAIDKVGTVSTSALDTAKSLSKTVMWVAILAIIILGVGIFVYFKYFYKKGDIAKAVATFPEGEEASTLVKAAEVVTSIVSETAQTSEASTTNTKADNTEVVSDDNK